MGVFNFGFEQLDLHLLHLNFRLVVLHLLRRVVDFNLDLVEFVNYRLYLGGQRLAGNYRSVIVFFRVFGDHQLLLNFALDLRFEFRLQTLHLSLVNLHLILIVLLLNIVRGNCLLDLVANRRVFIHLHRADVLFPCELVLNHSHSFLKSCAEVNTLLSLVVEHLLMHQVQFTVLLEKQLGHCLQSFALLQVGLDLTFDIVDLSDNVPDRCLVLSALLCCFAAKVSQCLQRSVVQLLQMFLIVALSEKIIKLKDRILVGLLKLLKF